MQSNELKNLSWYSDPLAMKKVEPGIQHSFMKSIATALNYVKDKFDPVWLMGSSAFAFRIFINENLCPSAMSIFDFSAILPETIEQSGYHAIYLSRYWNDDANEKIKREMAHSEIIDGIERGVPAVIWDIFDCEWGLITGYDFNKKNYYTMTHRGEKSFLSFEKLGHNGIDILSVSIIGGENQRNKNDIIMNSLRDAVSHAEGKEWTKRPEYQNGLDAFDLWASFYEKAGIIIDAGKINSIKPDIWKFAEYYASHYYSARCYARDYLKNIANGNDLLNKAASCYENVSTLLSSVWYNMVIAKIFDTRSLLLSQQNILEAKKSEQEGVEYIKAYLKESTTVLP